MGILAVKVVAAVDDFLNGDLPSEFVFPPPLPPLLLRLEFLNADGVALEDKFWFAFSHREYTAHVNRVGIDDFDDQVGKYASGGAVRVRADADDLESQQPTS